MKADSIRFTKRCSDRCVTHHHACDCREYAHQETKYRADRAEALLLDLFVVIGELTKGLEPNDSIYAEIQTLGQRYAEFLAELEG